MTRKYVKPYGPTQQVIMDYLADGAWRTTRDVLEHLPHYPDHENGFRAVMNHLLKLQKQGALERSKSLPGEYKFYRPLNIWRVNGHD
jgi:hypothetical protein